MEIIQIKIFKYLSENLKNATHFIYNTHAFLCENENELIEFSFYRPTIIKNSLFSIPTLIHKLPLQRLKIIEIQSTKCGLFILFGFLTRNRKAFLSRC